MHDLVVQRAAVERMRVAHDGRDRMLARSSLLEYRLERPGGPLEREVHEPGELDRFSSVGLFQGASELFLCAEWNEEFEPFPGRISSDLHDFNEVTPLGLEEWATDAGCLLAIGDGDGLNFVTPNADLAERLSAQFRTARR